MQLVELLPKSDEAEAREAKNLRTQGESSRSKEAQALGCRVTPAALGDSDASNPFVAVVACDMPFASATFLDAATKLMVQEGADVVIARSEEGYEPLHAVYRRETCLAAIEAAIEADQWKVIAWFPKVNLRVLTQDEIKHIDPDGLAFWNVNTPEEFAKAEHLATSESASHNAPG